LNGISARALKEKLDNKEKPFLIDTRGPDEFDQTRLVLDGDIVAWPYAREK